MISFGENKPPVIIHHIVNHTTASLEQADEVTIA